MPKTEKNKLVSVIMPSYNRADFITKSLDSVYKQTYRPIEIVVVDDGSSDDTEEVVKAWSKKHDGIGFKTTYFYQKNSGAPAARNKGIKEASGRYLQFLDSDDIILPQKLELQVEKLQKEKTALCICDYWHVDENDKIIIDLIKNFDIQTFLRNFIATHTMGPVLDRTKFTPNQLKWNEKITKLQDKDYFIKLLMLLSKKSYVNQHLFKWIRHEGEDRISNRIETGRKVYRNIFFSVILFQIKNYNSIPKQNWPAIRSLNKSLLRHALHLGAILKKIGWKK